MIFSEIYSCYYRTVAAIIDELLEKGLDINRFREIARLYAYKESPVFIENSVLSGEWQILNRDMQTPIKHKPHKPLTDLERRWLKAIAADSKIRLFTDRIEGLDDVEPLFDINDIICTDRFKSEDCYTDERYISIFRTLLNSVRSKEKVKIVYPQRDGRVTEKIYGIKKIEYSEKEDLFRAYSVHPNGYNVLKLCKIISAEPVCEPSNIDRLPLNIERSEVCIRISDERNALERVLLHFAAFEKSTVRLSDGKYEMTLKYNTVDLSEVLISILSFGPMVEVISPESTRGLIKSRIIKQKICGE